ncbi:Zn-ribbon domain-containing OB-fold protein [Natrarchaeobius chitinivorans]|uniref:Uncharacterized protein n=1 Tax=Natrarchaeobius chitinivorans TaxID=1679083 RepID=A0A3N6MID8_NATCH|nr:zinc ribbon domain-containing protein [Natrarchaeobius chitinivorans]RQG95421.1 hypothetical protein EA473_08125 [Natrarchaeobius chitinivorans]
MGAYISLPTWWQNLEQRYRFVLGECLDCGAYNFPADGACSVCSSLTTFREVEPEGTGEIVTKTVMEEGAPPEFESYLQREGTIGVVIVELDEGVLVPGMLTDCDPYAPERGDRVERTIRRIYEQEGIVRYGAKFRPVVE